MTQDSIDGEWRELRHDPALSGHQPMAGAIDRPRVVWRHYLGGGLFDVEPVPLGDRHGLLVLYGGCIHCYDIVGNLIWKSPAQGFEGISAVVDLDNDGRIEIVAGNGKSLFVLDAGTGAILWSTYLGPPAACGFMHTAALVHHFPAVGTGMQIVVGLLSSNEVTVFDCTPGASRIERTQILWMDDFFHPSILAVDIDGDGVDEIVVTKYSAIYAFDAATGRQKSVCRWASGGTPKRNYGLFLSADIVGTGAPGFLILSEKVSKHLSAVANDGAGNLSLLWDRFLEHIYPDDRRELRYSFNSLVDIDGDGRLEIIVSFYDEAEGGRWWLEVIDAASGEIRQRLDDLYLHGIQRLDPDELPVVCATEQRARIPARFSTATVWRWSDGALRPVHSMPRRSFAGRFVRQSPVATAYRADLPASSEVWTIRDGDTTALVLIGESGALSFAGAEKGIWSESVISCAIDVDAVMTVFDLNADGEEELVVANNAGDVRVIDRAGESLGWFRAGMRFRYGTGAYYRSKPMQVPAVAAHEGRRYLAGPDGGASIHLLELPTTSGERVERRWRLPGRGRCGPEESYHGVGFRGEGERLGVVFSAVGGTSAALVSVDLDGEEIWRRDVPGLPVSASFDIERIGIYDYQLVPDGDRSLLVISGYRSSSMNSEETIGFEFETGRELWRRRTVGEGENGRGFGPWNLSSRLASPQSSLYYLAKDTFLPVDPRTGAAAMEPWQLRSFNTAHLQRRGLRVDDFAAYGSLVPVDVDGDGLFEIVIAGAYGGVGVVGSDGAMRWWQSAPLSTLSGSFFGIADIDGDGLPELGMSTSDGDFVVLRADDGLEKWRLHLGEVATDVISCDIDGDGRIEFIAATQQGSVIAIGCAASGAGLVKWRLDLGYSPGPPVAADIDGDGRSEIVVVSGDGHIYAIGGSGRVRSADGA